ncbi:MAG: hypothetical protein VR72_04575 [Clostridiaceae bacterium BRH_c20a]|nr:MAG: hypothetical protein VR72_04575 [Clostridiaceae bacterium BRH_c20a]
MRWEELFKTVAVIVAAGQGSRMGTKVNKQYLNLMDKPILVHTLEVFEKHPLIDGIIVVSRQDEVNFCYQEIVKPYHFNKVLEVVVGGKERQDSVFEGLKALPVQCELVVVHDGARPLIAQNIISEAIALAQEKEAAIVAVPVKDTIKRVISGAVRETIPRGEIWAVQTPQVFNRELLLKAYQFAYEQGICGTDDASLIELIGKDVRVVLGSYENIKITTPEDLDIGNAILARRLK